MATGERARGGAGDPDLLDAAAAARRERMRGHVALVFVQVFFGLFPFFGKVALGAFDPRAIVGWRIVLGALVLGLLAVLRHGRRALPSSGEVPRALLCALLGVVLNQGLFLEGIDRTTAVDAGVLMASIPIFTFAFALAARQEAFHPARAAGLAVALAGVLLLAGRDLSEVDLGPEHRAGNLLILANCASYGLYLVVARPLLARRPPLVVIAWVYVFAVASVPVLVAGRPVLPGDVPPDVLARAVWGLAYVVVFPTILSYLLNTFALARVRASTTAVYIYLQPLVASASGVLWLDETLPPAVVAAAACLFAGIWLVAGGPWPRRGGWSRGTRGR